MHKDWHENKHRKDKNPFKKSEVMIINGKNYHYQMVKINVSEVNEKFWYAYNDNKYW